MLRDVRHLLLLSEHLNLHLLLLRKGHEVIEHVLLLVAARLHIFAVCALAVVEVGAVGRAISPERPVGNVAEVSVAARLACVVVAMKLLRGSLLRYLLHVDGAASRCALVPAATGVVVSVSQYKRSRILDQTLSDGRRFEIAAPVVALIGQRAELLLGKVVRAARVLRVVHAQWRLRQSWPLIHVVSLSAF